MVIERSCANTRASEICGPGAFARMSARVRISAPPKQMCSDISVLEPISADQPAM